MRYSFLTILLGVAACDAPGGHGGGDAPATTPRPDTSDSEGPTPDATGVQPSDATSVQPSDATSAQPSDATSAQPSDATSAQPGDTTGADVVDDDVPLGPSGPSAPVILALSTSVTRVTEGERVTFSAIVTDPDGIDDLIGGRLRDPSLDITYGAFATAASEGAYALSLTWDDLHHTIPIAFDGGERERAFVAEFFDQAGHATTGVVRLVLHCDGEPACDGACAETACDGACLPVAALASDEQNCGACGATCPGGATCDDGRCRCPAGMEVCDGRCADLDSDGEACGACGVVCPSGKCDAGICECTPVQGCPGDQTCVETGASINGDRCRSLGAVSIGGTADGSVGRVAIELDGESVEVCASSSGVAPVACRDAKGEGWLGYQLPGDSVAPSRALRFMCQGDESALRDCRPTLITGCASMLRVECLSETMQHIATTTDIDQGEAHYRQLSVPDARTILIATEAPHDVDLYVSFDRSVSRSDADAASATESGNESILFPVPGAGTLHILVYGYEASTYTLTTSEP